MATLQKIRNRGKILIVCLGLALFAFIAEEFVRSLSYTKAETRQRVGEIYGKSINVQDYNALVDEYTDVIKFTNGLTSLNDDQVSMIRDQVWQTYVNQQLIGHECDKLGLSVTDAELQDIISKGTNPMLSQTPFRTQQGTFDYNALKQFLSQYDEVMNNTEIPSQTKDQYTQMFNYWKFVEKNIRQQTLMQKFQSLLNGALISNPVSAKMAFDGRTNESNILMAALPYTAIKDADVKIEDSELQAKYAEMKDLFKSSQETRDIKYIDIEVKASQTDIEDLNKEMQGYAEALAAEGADPAKIVRESSSQISFSTLPISKKALPTDIATELDSLTEGSQKGPYLNANDNTVNIIRLLSKVSRPDSVEVRQIGVPGADMAAIQKTADSIMTALNAGEVFDSIAKKYNQPATRTWLTSAQYEGQAIDENNRIFIETITTAPVNVYNKIELTGQGIVIAQVTDRRNIIDKYNVAIIKRAQDFSKDTYGKAYNDFSSFLAGKKTAEEIEAEAQKAGYTVQTRQGMSSAEHHVANVHSTRDALRWIFNKDTKVGDISPLYECGENDHLLVCILTGIHKKGYVNWDDEQVKSFLTTEVMKDKKAAQFKEKMANVKSIADVEKIQGAVTDTIKHVSFTNNVFVSKVGASEPALSGAISGTKPGDFKSGIKGNSAVYAFQVLDQHKHEGTYDQKKEEQQLSQSNSRALSNFTSELYEKAKVVDNRYIFY